MVRKRVAAGLAKGCRNGLGVTGRVCHGTPGAARGRNRGDVVVADIDRVADDGPMSAPRPVVFVLFDGFQSLDLTGPLEVFAGADRWHTARRGGAPAYELRTAGPAAGAVRSSSG